jgi:hypothetical protein
MTKNTSTPTKPAGQAADARVVEDNRQHRDSAQSVNVPAMGGQGRDL